MHTSGAQQGRLRLIALVQTLCGISPMQLALLPPVMPTQRDVSRKLTLWTLTVGPDPIFGSSSLPQCLARTLPRPSSASLL